MLQTPFRVMGTVACLALITGLDRVYPQIQFVTVLACAESQNNIRNVTAYDLGLVRSLIAHSSATLGSTKYFSLPLSKYISLDITQEHYLAASFSCIFPFFFSIKIFLFRQKIKKNLEFTIFK